VQQTNKELDEPQIEEVQYEHKTEKNLNDDNFGDFDNFDNFDQVKKEPVKKNEEGFGDFGNANKNKENSDGFSDFEEQLE
jgi:hypothetical protein